MWRLLPSSVSNKPLAYILNMHTRACSQFDFRDRPCKSGVWCLQCNARCCFFCILAPRFTGESYTFHSSADMRCTLCFDVGRRDHSGWPMQRSRDVRLPTRHFGKLARARLIAMQHMSTVMYLHSLEIITAKVYTT